MGSEDTTIKQMAVWIPITPASVIKHTAQIRRLSEFAHGPVMCVLIKLNLAMTGQSIAQCTEIDVVKRKFLIYAH